MASKYIQKFPVPEKFPEILHDLSKEILRYQPKNIIEFCAKYFKCLQEGKELEYEEKGSNIPCDFKNVIPGEKTSERSIQKDKSNYNEALEKAKNLNVISSEEKKIDSNNTKKNIVIKAEEQDKIDPPAEVVLKKIEPPKIIQQRVSSAKKIQERKDEENEHEIQNENEIDNNNELQVQEHDENARKLTSSFINDLMSKSFKEEN